jgi:hypothetical protein
VRLVASQETYTVLDICNTLKTIDRQTDRERASTQEGGGEKEDQLLEGSQASPALPSGKSIMKMELC